MPSTRPAGARVVAACPGRTLSRESAAGHRPGRRDASGSRWATCATGHARPLVTLARRDVDERRGEPSPDWPASTTRAELVVGLPLSLDGSEGPQADAHPRVGGRRGAAHRTARLVAGRAPHQPGCRAAHRRARRGAARVAHRRPPRCAPTAPVSTVRRRRPSPRRPWTRRRDRSAIGRPGGAAVTWTGRGEPSLTEPVTGTRGQRQGSISSSELLGLKRARPRGPWRGLVFLVVLMLVIVVGGGVFVGTQAARGGLRPGPLQPPGHAPADGARTSSGNGSGDKLTTPAGTRATPVKFTVEGGETVGQIGRALASAGPHHWTRSHSPTSRSPRVSTTSCTPARFNLDPTHDAAADPHPPPVAARPGHDDACCSTCGRACAWSRSPPTSRPCRCSWTRQAFYQLMTDPPDWVRTEFPWLKALPNGQQPGRLHGPGHRSRSMPTSRPRTCSGSC